MTILTTLKIGFITLTKPFAIIPGPKGPLFTYKKKNPPGHYWETIPIETKMAETLQKTKGCLTLGNLQQKKTTLPEGLEEKDIPLIICFEAQQNIPYALDELVWIAEPTKKPLIYQIKFWKIIQKN